MSMMCKMNSSCSTSPGMCVHEKMMLAMALMIMAGVATYLLFA